MFFSFMRLRTADGKRLLKTGFPTGALPLCLLIRIVGGCYIWRSTKMIFPVHIFFTFLDIPVLLGFCYNIAIIDSVFNEIYWV